MPPWLEEKSPWFEEKPPYLEEKALEITGYSA
jgi:hypothetical protein